MIIFVALLSTHFNRSVFLCSRAGCSAPDESPPLSYWPHCFWYSLGCHWFDIWNVKLPIWEVQALSLILIWKLSLKAQVNFCLRSQAYHSVSPCQWMSGLQNFIALLCKIIHCEFNYFSIVLQKNHMWFMIYYSSKFLGTWTEIKSFTDDISVAWNFLQGASRSSYKYSSCNTSKCCGTSLLLLILFPSLFS